MMVGTLDENPTPTQLAEAMVYVTHPCDPGCCPEASMRLYVSIYGGDDFDPHAPEETISFDERALPLSLDDSEIRMRAVIAAIITNAERRATKRAAEVANAISSEASTAILAAMGNP